MLTVAVLIGHRLYRMLSPALLAIVVCLLAPAGPAFASLATHPAALWLGNGLVSAA